MDFFQVEEAVTKEWLESEKTSLIALSKEIKSQKKLVLKSKSAYESLKKGAQTLETKWQKSKEKFKKGQNEIRMKRKRIRRLKKLLEKAQGRKEEIRNQLEQAEKTFEAAKAHSEELYLAMKDLQLQFDELGKAVKESVDKRTELYSELDAQTVNLHKLELEEPDVDVDELCKDDPLFLIESNYPFFQNANKCSPEDVGNVENPKRCMEAMDSFVNVLHENIHRFKHLPMGPLYQSVVVKTKKWAPLVEYVLRPLLFVFLVDNIVDSLVMEELLEEHFPSGSAGQTNADGVITPSYHIFPFTNQYVIEPRITAMSGMELENMLETIHFYDDNWGNFLSQAIGIEKVILMDNENIAFLVLSHIKNTPWQCKKAYTLDGFVVYPFPDFRTKQIKLYERSMYLKCLPSYKVGEIRSKIWRTKAYIERTNTTICTQRGSQLKMAKQIDEMRRKIGVSHSYERLCLAMKKEIVCLLNEPMSCSAEKKELKYLKGRLKKLRTTAEQYESEFKIKAKALLEAKKDFDANTAALEQLEEQLKGREEVFFTTRDALWRLEDEMEAAEMDSCSCEECQDNQTETEFSE